MPKYEVILKEIEIYNIEIEAETEVEACNQAWELLTESESNKAKYHNDSDGESSASEID